MDYLRSRVTIASRGTAPYFLFEYIDGGCGLTERVRLEHRASRNSRPSIFASECSSGAGTQEP